MTLDSLDDYFSRERVSMASTDKNVRALIDTLNSNTTSGHKKIYEVIQ